MKKKSDIQLVTITEPHRFDVVLSRIKGHAETNVPHSVIEHSPDGFEFGYGGSGPADLALNILNAYVPPGSDDYKPVACYRGKASRTAMDLHQPFKWAFIAKMPPEGGTIPAAEIMHWLNHELKDAGLIPG